VARRLATLDFISHGRAGWNIVTTAEPAAAGNFGDQPHPPAADRYERAGEFVDVVLRLWDAWENGAAVMARDTGQWADLDRVHPPGHHGQYFDVAGYLPFPRSPQGHPFLTQAGTSAAGKALAAKYADAVFTPLASVPAGVAFRDDLRAQAAARGREPGHIRVLPGLSFLLAGSDAEAAALKDALEAAASPEFRWRNLAHLAGLDYTTIDPDAPCPPGLLAGAPRTSFGAAISRMVAEEPAAPFRAVAMKLSALPGGLDFTGTPEGLADLLVGGGRRGRVHAHAARASRSADRVRRSRGADPAATRPGPHRVRRDDPARPRRSPPAGRRGPHGGSRRRSRTAGSRRRSRTAGSRRQPRTGGTRRGLVTRPVS
jgi:FMN-dependent oxidoreductase (nitrilotriacetate monooxygenase family)